MVIINNNSNNNNNNNNNNNSNNNKNNNNNNYDNNNKITNLQKAYDWLVKPFEVNLNILYTNTDYRIPTSCNYYSPTELNTYIKIIILLMMYLVSLKFS